MADTSLIYVTTGSEEEARQIAAALVEARLVACANMLPGMKSIYRWQGEIQSDREVVLILKTQTSLVDMVTDKVKELHSYDCPCVVALSIAGGNPAFLDWIGEQTSSSR